MHVFNLKHHHDINTRYPVRACQPQPRLHLTWGRVDGKREGLGGRGGREEGRVRGQGGREEGRVRGQGGTGRGKG